jgi:hypothetical protein
LDQLLGYFFKAFVRLCRIEPLAQNRMGLQARVIANENGMKLAGGAYQKPVPRFFLGSQYQYQFSEQVYRLASEHGFLKKEGSASADPKSH